MAGDAYHRPWAKASRRIGMTEPKQSQNPKDRPFKFPSRRATAFLKMLQLVISRRQNPKGTAFRQKTRCVGTGIFCSAAILFQLLKLLLSHPVRVVFSEYRLKRARNFQCLISGGCKITQTLEHSFIL